MIITPQKHAINMMAHKSDTKIKTSRSLRDIRHKANKRCHRGDINDVKMVYRHAVVILDDI